MSIVSGILNEINAHDIFSDSCNYFVEGYIYDLESQKAIPFASVQVLGTTKGNISDISGYFKITNLCIREFDLSVSHVGYKKVIHHHDTYHKNPQIFLASDSFKLASVVVEGNQIPGQFITNTISSLEPNSFDVNNTSLGELTSKINGVGMLKTGQNVVKPIIHGLHSNRILIINNGVRHEFQNWGSDHAPEISPSSTKQISIVKGASTVKYGPDALGGVIVLEPRKVDFFTPFNGHLRGFAASNGNAYGGNLNMSKGYHKVALQANLSYVKQGDLNAPNYLLTNTGKNEVSGSVSGKYHWNNFDLNAYYSHFDQELGVLRGSITGSLNDLANAINSEEPSPIGEFSYQINNPRQKIKHNLFKLEGVWSTDIQNVKSVYAYQSNSRQEFDIRRGTNNDLPAINLNLNSHSLDVEWNHPVLYNWEGQIGIQGQYQDNNNIGGTNTVPFIPNYNTIRLGIFAIESYSIADLKVEWGIRYDFQFTSVRGRAANNDIFRDEIDFQNITATIGILKPLGSNKVFRSNIGTAWRPPNVSELYSFGKHSASIEYGLWRFRVLENQGISTDKVLNSADKKVNSEVGYKWINTYEIYKDNFQFELTAYINFIDNYIYSKPAGITNTVRGAFPYFIYDQDKALLSGLDANLNYDHHISLTSEASLSFLWAKNINTNDYFVGLPPASANYNLTYRLKDVLFLKNQKISSSMSYTLNQFFSPPIISIQDILEAKESDNDVFVNDADFDITPPPPAYFLANIGYHVEIKTIDISFVIDNIFNTEYRSYTDRLRYFADDMGRNFRLNVSYNF